METPMAIPIWLESVAQDTVGSAGCSTHSAGRTILARPCKCSSNRPGRGSTTKATGLGLETGGASQGFENWLLVIFSDGFSDGLWVSCGFLRALTEGWLVFVHSFR